MAKKQRQIVKPGTKIDFVGTRKRFGLISGAVISGAIVVLIVNLFTRGSMLNYGIDFRGGTQIQIEFQSRPGLGTKAVRNAMTSLNFTRVSVIKAGTEGNAYVIRMEEASSMDKTKRKRLKQVLAKSFQRTTLLVNFKDKGATKRKELLADAKKRGYALASLGISEPAGRSGLIIPLRLGKSISSAKADALAKEVSAKFSAEVTTEAGTALRRERLSSSGESVRLIFSEPVTEAEIRTAFAGAKVDLATSAGAVARRGRQERNKIKWQVRLLGLGDRLTKDLNDKLKRFVKGTGKLQTLHFALDVKQTDADLRKALARAGFGADKAYALRITFSVKEKQKPGDVETALRKAGLTVADALTTANRIGDPDDKRWYADLSFAKFMPVAQVKAAVEKDGGKLRSVAVRLTETRFREAIGAAGYQPNSSLALRVEFQLDRASTTKELTKALAEVKLPLAKHREKIARVGAEAQHRWLVILDVKGNVSGSDIESKLRRVGAVGITSIEIPPHGAVKTILAVERVGSKVGKKLRTDGILSVLYTLAFILVYIGLRFDLKFAPGAVVALIHDVMITVGIWAVFWLEFNLATIAALLTIVGYSLNDTIVVFDRIRENLSRLRDVKLGKVINVSLNETLSRTLLTSITTLLSIAAILFLASGDLWLFAFALAIGVLIGTYSSVYVASPIVLALDSWLAKRADATKPTGDKGGGRSGGRGGGGRGGRGGRKKGSDLREAEASP